MTPAPAAPEPSAPGVVITELPREWIHGAWVGVIVLQPRVTIVPAVARPGQVVTVYVEDVPPGAEMTLAWTRGFAPPLLAAAPAGEDWHIETQLIVRREMLGPRDLEVGSPSALFGDFGPRDPLLVAPRSAVADELVGRGG